MLLPLTHMTCRYEIASTFAILVGADTLHNGIPVVLFNQMRKDVKMGSQFGLPLRHYVHMGAKSILEFAPASQMAVFQFASFRVEATIS